MHKLLITLFCFLLPVTAWADMHDAMQALKNEDYARAATELKPLAEQGDAVAQSHLGYLYYTGEGVPQSFDEAVKWYLKAAVQGNRDAQYNLAVAYAFGEGEKQDYKEAAVWYRRAAEQGHAVAQYSLGLSYAYGEGVKQDDKAAAQWFLKSADQGYVNAQVMVGSLYHTGDGFPKDYTKAVEWYRKAADKGNEIAQYNLGVIYRAGKGVDKNTDEAIKWFRLAADQGYEPAQNELSTMERAMAGAAKENTPAIEPPVPSLESQSESAKNSINQEPVKQTPAIAGKTEVSPVVKKEQETTPANNQEKSVTSGNNNEIPAKSEPVSTATDEESGKSGGFFSSLKGLFKSDKTASDEATEKTIETAKEPVAQTITTVKETTVPETATATATKQEPVNETADISSTPVTEKKRIFKPAQNTGIQDLLSRQRVIAPEINDQSIQNQVSTQTTDQTGPVATLVPEEQQTPAQEAVSAEDNTSTDDESSGVVGYFKHMFSSSENKTESPDTKVTGQIPAQEDTAQETQPPSIVANTKTAKSESIDENNNATKEETTTEKASNSNAADEKESGGLVGYFKHMFSSSEDKPAPDSQADNKETVQAIKEKEEPYSATTYSINSKKSEHQLADVQDEREKNHTEDKEPAETTIVDKSKPVITEIEPKETAASEPVVAQADTAENKNEEKKSFFSRLFGSDNKDEDDTGTNELSDKNNAASSEDNTDTISNNDQDKSLNKIQSSDGGKQEENLQIAKAEDQTTTQPSLNNTAEQEIESNVTTSPLDLLQERAVSGDPAAQYELGNDYYEGIQVKQDFDQAFIWYRRSALQGNADAQYHLGTMYLMGEGIEQNDLEARNWYEKAADQGHEAAKHNLENLQRVLPEKTEIAGSNDTTSVADSANSAKQDKKEKGVLGFVKGLFGSDKNEEEPQQTVAAVDSTDSTPQTSPAEPQLTPPAESDYKRGLAYTYGDGVPQNYITAFKYFQSAALQGYAPAQYELGIVNESGRGTQKNIQEAIEWYKKAAQQGYVMAQRSLGNIYMNGEGVDQNKPLALAWYSILAEKGNVLDIHRRDLLKEQLTGDEIRESEKLKEQLVASLSTTSNSLN